MRGPGRFWLLCAAGLAGLVAAPLAAEDGLLDTTFSGDGLLLLDWSGGAQPAHALAAGAFPDGSLLVAGTVDVGSSNDDFGFVRLRANGAIDSGWGSAGRRLVAIDSDPGGVDTVWTLAILPDGAAIAAGFTRVTLPDPDPPISVPALVRLNADGDPDPAFGDAGVAVLEPPWPSPVYSFRPPVAQPDGKVIFAGFCNHCPLVSDGRSTMLLRVGTDGAPDPAFSGDGWVRESTGSIGALLPYEVDLDGAGRIVVIGGVGTDLGLLRLTPAGAIDTSFGGGDGLVTFPRPVGLTQPYGFAVDRTSGAIYFSIGVDDGPNAGFTEVRRFTANGSPDTAFGGDGVVELVYQEGIRMESMVVQSDGRILLGGDRFDAETNDREWMIYRLTAAGVPDPTFDVNGRRLVSFDEPAGLGSEIESVILSGGRPVAVGRVRYDGVDQFGVARITSDLIFRDGFERASVGGWGGN